MTPGEQCGYLSCGTFGVARARCVEGAWAVTTEACAPFACGPSSSQMCQPGSICRTRVGGALISECEAAPACDGGALSCQCVCGGACVGSGGAVDPPLQFACNNCPSGTCP